LLESLSEEVRQCYGRAEECAGQAWATRDEKLRADYLRLARGWLKLARSYELWQRLKLFTDEAASPLFSNYLRNCARICEAASWYFADEFGGGAGRREVGGIVTGAAGAAKKKSSSGLSGDAA
jgi:hypothetical protein